MASSELLKAILVSAELMGTPISADAARVLESDLSLYPEPQVFKALTRCRRELRGRLTIAEIINRLEDGRPGAEEAWAMLPKSEADSVVWTEEMAAAFGVCEGLTERDGIAARMAFREAYTAKVSEARANRVSPKWSPSLGHDLHAREAALRTGVEKGRISRDQALRLLPHSAEIQALPAPIEEAVQKLLKKGIA